MKQLKYSLGWGYVDTETQIWEWLVYKKDFLRVLVNKSKVES